MLCREMKELGKLWRAMWVSTNLFCPFPPYPEFLAPGNSPLPRRVLFFLNHDGVLELK